MTEEPKQTASNLGNEAELYLLGKRDQALLNLSHRLNKRDVEDIVPILKQDLYKYVSRQYPNFEGNIDMLNPPYVLLRTFDAEKFFARKWKHVPYYLSDHDYDRLQGCVKNPIYVKRYKYDKPIYDFANSRIFDDTKRKQPLSQSVVKSDVQFYLSAKEDIMFAKTVLVKYNPKFLRMADGEARVEEHLLNDSDLYDRSFSISMYVLLDGDPGKPMPFMRYDNDNFPHTNVWVGNDRRRTVFGDTALSPHFHFQNERDGLLCLRKFKGNDHKLKYKEGRCNAIDCKHLKYYLKALDRRRNSENEDPMGMPFVRLKREKRAVNVDVEEIVAQYVKNSPGDGLDAVYKWLEKTNMNADYQPQRDKYFPKLIKALDFLAFVTARMRVSVDSDEKKVLSDLEMVTANAIMDGINLASTKTLREGEYEVDYEFDDHRQTE